jgi:hypothetical protein
VTLAELSRVAEPKKRHPPSLKLLAHLARLNTPERVAQRIEAIRAANARRRAEQFEAAV